MVRFEHRRARWIAALTVVAAAVHGAREARAEDALDEDSGRTLAGHRYVPSSMVSWPFITTDVNSVTDAGMTKFTFTPGMRTALNLAPLSGKFAQVDQSLSMRVAPTPWFALEVAGNGAGLIPRSTTAAILVGGFGALGLDLGASLRAARTGPFELVVRAAVGRSWVEGVVPTLLPQRILVTGTMDTLRGSAAAALTLGPRVGLQMGGTFQGNRLDVAGSDDSITIEGGAALTFDCAPIPVMALLAGGVATDFDRDPATTSATILFGDDETRWSGELGFYYHGRTDFDLGASYRFVITHGDANRSFAQVRLAYYF